MAMDRCGVDNVRKPQRIGLFGGTFDPVHNGHLAVADCVQKAFKLTELWFIPAPIPPHKKAGQEIREVSSFTDRAAMLELALAGREYFTLSRIETELPAPSYTIQTLREIRMRIGRDTMLFFIIGVDAFVEIETWKDYPRLPTLAEFVVISRSADQYKEVEEVVSKNFTKYRRHAKECFWVPEDDGEGKIHFLEMEPVAISSTGIRRMVHDGYPVRDLVPPGVAEYIQDHFLYL